MSEVATILFGVISILITLLSGYFWHDRNQIQKRIEKIEDQAMSNFTKLQEYMGKIQQNISSIQQQLATSRALVGQRPLRECQNYFTAVVDKLKSDLIKQVRYAVVQELKREKITPS